MLPRGLRVEEVLMARSTAVRTAMALGVAVVGLTLAAPASSLAATRTKRASVTSSGAQSFAFVSATPVISANGRYVAFESDGADLVAGDRNDTDDIYVHDRRTGNLKRASVRTKGGGGTEESEAPALSANGRFVAFESDSALVKGDHNEQQDIFVRDLVARRTTRVSVRSNGTAGDDDSGSPAISATGRFVAFDSGASNLVPHDTLGQQDVFIHDRVTGKTKRVSVAWDGSATDGDSQNASISSDGRFVAFDSQATDLVQNDKLGHRDVFVRDRKTGHTELVSVSSDGSEGNGDSSFPAISADGRWVAFTSAANNLVPGDTLGFDDVFVHDRKTGKTRRMSVGLGGVEADGRSSGAAISADGRLVGFVSQAANLLTGDTKGFEDAFVRDRITGATTRVSVRSNGAEGLGDSSAPTLSGDGRFVAFASRAENLVAGDSNSDRDAFWRGPL
jgi:Tol biopolymer transport system component